jgi:hypothetical protein
MSDAVHAVACLPAWPPCSAMVPFMPSSKDSDSALLGGTWGLPHASVDEERPVASLAHVGGAGLGPRSPPSLEKPGASFRAPPPPF